MKVFGATSQLSSATLAFGTSAKRQNWQKVWDMCSLHTVVENILVFSYKSSMIVIIPCNIIKINNYTIFGISL